LTECEPSVDLSAPPAPCLVLKADMEAPRFLPCAGGTAALLSRSRPGDDHENEDAAGVFGLAGERGLLVVADGAGGHALGAEAAEACLRSLAETFEPAPPADSGLRSLVLDGIERAGERVAALGAGAASTLAVVEIDGTSIRSYHVGDSEILVTGQRGRVRLQIVPHSPTGYAIEAGFLSAAAAMRHEERHVVSNLVGAGDMRIEIGPSVRLRPRDTVLVASDGLFDNLRQEEIVGIVRCGPLERAAAKLADRVLKRMLDASPGKPSKPDDLTFVLWRPRVGGEAERRT